MENGYSGTPLAKKLGIKEGFKVYLVNQPSFYFELFNNFPKVTIAKRGQKESFDFIHLFSSHSKHFQKEIKRIKPFLKKGGMLWVSWPKGSSDIETDLKREPIREFVLKTGLVDIKVAAIDKNWSGLKFVYRVNTL